MNISRLLFKYAGGLAVVLAIVAGLLIAVQTVPEWQVRRASVRSTAVLPEADTTPIQIAGLQNEMRKTFVQVLGGVFVVLALWFTYRRTKVTEQGHITDRYTKAIEQLGATKIVAGATIANVEVRLGAIYALERIALDSARDHWTIMEVLTAYVRENAPVPEGNSNAKEMEKLIAKGPPTEIQAILTVLGRRRRNWPRERRGKSLDLKRCDLKGADFRETHFERADFGGAHGEQAKFSKANLAGARFIDAHIEGAKFDEAHIEGAYLSAAYLEGTDFEGTYAESAYFDGAHLEDAYLFRTNAKGADFRGAHLERTDFSSANLVNAKFGDAYLKQADFSSANVEAANFYIANDLTLEQISRANGWEKASLPLELVRNLDLSKKGYSMPDDVENFEQESRDTPE